MFSKLFDYILPQFCVACELEGAVLCKKCLNTVDISGIFLCPDCDRPSPGGVVHVGCASSLDSLVAVASYAQPVVQHMVQLCKYQYIESVGNKMGEMCREVVRFVPDVSDGVIVIPVSLHKKRYASRGFNQAALIAEHVADMLGVVCDEDVLVRTKATKRQVDMVGSDRIHNVSDAFSVIKKPPRKVILVDDVATSGSTLSACARALKEAGCQSVSAVVFGRG